MTPSPVPAAPAVRNPPSSTAPPSADAAEGAAEGPPRPAELSARLACGRALLWSGEPERSLDALAPVHRARPWDREVQHLMLDALAALGRPADDYPWTREPALVRIEPSLLDDLARTLIRNGAPATVLDLMLAAGERGYPTFTARELAAALAADRRFRVHAPGLAAECGVVAPSPAAHRSRAPNND